MGAVSGSAQRHQKLKDDCLQAKAPPPPKPNMTAEERKLYDIQTACWLLGLKAPTTWEEAQELAAPSTRTRCKFDIMPPVTRMQAAMAEVDEKKATVAEKREAWLELHRQRDLSSDAAEMQVNAEQRVAQMRKQVADISEAQLQEVAALQAPPEVCQRTIEMVCAVLGKEGLGGKSQTSWHALRRKLVSEIVPDMRRSQLPLLSASRVEAIEQEYLKGRSALTKNTVQHANQACFILFLWATAVLRAVVEIGQATKLAAVEAEVRASWEKAIQAAESELETARAELDTAERCMRSLPFEATYT